MSKPIFDPMYWRGRLDLVRERKLPLHHSVFVVNEDRWRAIEEAHRAILRQHVAPCDSVLDVGCGYGRLLSLLPESWRGEYLGIDVSPEFVELARRSYPNRTFAVLDARYLPAPEVKHDWGVLISIRPMVRREAGTEAWDTIERRLRLACKKLLYLEYDPADPGSTE